jgi:hypothetical protein
MNADDIVLDDLPDYVRAAMEVRARWVSAMTSGGYEFLASDLTAWPPSRPVRVAFRGGDAALRSAIVEATAAITDACGIVLDFWTDASRTVLREWASTDADYIGDIRVSFDLRGFFSLVGQDSVNREISPPDEPVGGRPGQCSLNLGGFVANRPPNWRGVVRHEFLHALGFHHEHQNIRGPCEAQFRWDDDPGYVPTTNAHGSFVADPAGRRPGIYTDLAGPPNRWSRAKVDHNLRTSDDPGAIASVFDRKSVMLYRFPPLFYRVDPSPCAPEGDGEELSEGDVRGLRLLYPQPADRVLESQAERRRHLLESLGRPSPGVERGLERMPSTTIEAPFIAEMRRMLRANGAQ